MNPEPPPISDPHSTYSLSADKKALSAKATALSLMLVGSLLFAFGVLLMTGIIALLPLPGSSKVPSIDDDVFITAFFYGSGFLLVFLGVRRWKRL